MIHNLPDTFKIWSKPEYNDISRHIFGPDYSVEEVAIKIMDRFVCKNPEMYFHGVSSPNYKPENCVSCMFKASGVVDYCALKYERVPMIFIEDPFYPRFKELKISTNILRED